MSSTEDWLNKVPTQNDDAAWRMVDDECIIIVPETSQATVLNPVAARIWELADGKRMMSEVIALIVEEYDVTPEAAEQDAREFTSELVKRGLLAF